LHFLSLKSASPRNQSAKGYPAVFFNLAMLLVAYSLLLVSLLWLAKPVRLVNPY